MNNSYADQIQLYLAEVTAGNTVVPQHLIVEMSEQIKFALEKTLCKPDSEVKKFKLRLSSIGQPLCQLQMAALNADSIPFIASDYVKFMFGDMHEALLVGIIKAAGIDVQEVSTHVKLPVKLHSGEIYEVPGTLDLVIDGKVWDVKSASAYAFADKFASYYNLRAHDDFGYLPQLFAYAEARGLPPGGWIVINKETGEVKVVEVPWDYHADMQKALDTITNNVNILLASDSVFVRKFSDHDETRYKKPTGNKILKSPCIFCKFKFSCWPNLKHLPDTSSTAASPTYKYYTEINPNANQDSISESEGEKPTKVGGRKSKKAVSQAD